MTLTAPELLSERHVVSYFNSGLADLDDWLRRRALTDQHAGVSRTFVACGEGGSVAGYYALASGSIETIAAVGRFRRTMPEPVPVVVLARLAVDLGHQRCGLGWALFRDAVRRVLHAADTIGIRGIVVHAISEEAKAFYIAVGLEHRRSNR